MLNVLWAVVVVMESYGDGPTARLLSVQSVSLRLAPGLVIISQLDEVANEPAEPAGPGSDTRRGDESESESTVLEKAPGSL